MKSISTRLLYVAAVFASFVLFLLAVWIKSQHTPSEAIQVATEFLQRLEAQQFEQAFELTVKRGYVGSTPDELRSIARQQLCKIDQQTYTFPFQSNGNRLRRFFLGREVEMPEVHVEFSGGACLLGVAVHQTADNTWRVFRFASHAG